MLSGGTGGEEGTADCSTLYYDGCDEETSVDSLPSLIQEGAITDETLCWSQDAAWPFDGWTPWWECSYFFGFDAPEICSSLYYEGGEEEVSRSEALTLVEAGTITESTLVYSDDEPFYFEGWTAWWECSYLFGVGEAPSCTTLYYEGCDDEVSKEQALELLEAGAITDETLVYSSQNSFPFEGWTAWWQCSYAFGVGEAPDGTCRGLYYEGGEDEGEIAKERAEELVEAGTITDSTLIYSDDAAFRFEGWTYWSDCSYLFGIGVAPSGGCTKVWIEGCDEELGMAELTDWLQTGKVTDETLCYSGDPGFYFEGWTAYGECKECFSIADAGGLLAEPELEPEPEPDTVANVPGAKNDSSQTEGGTGCRACSGDRTDEYGADDDVDDEDVDDREEDEQDESMPGNVAGKPKVGGPTGVKKNRKKNNKGSDAEAGGIPKRKKKKKPPMGDGSGGGIPAKPKRGSKPEKHKKKKKYGMAEGTSLIQVENPDESSTSNVIYTLEQLQDKSWWERESAEVGGPLAGVGLEDRWKYLSVRR